MKFFKPYLLSLVLPALAFAQPPSSPPGPAIAFDKSSVSVAGISPKGQAVLFSVAREIADDDVATVVRRSQVLGGRRRGRRGEARSRPRRAVRLGLGGGRPRPRPGGGGGA